MAYVFATPDRPAELYLLAPGGGAASKLTDLNAVDRAEREIATVEAFTFVSNDNKWEVEAFLTRPLGMTRGRRSIR